MYEPDEICGDCEQDPCECDAIALADAMDPDWDVSDIRAHAHFKRYTEADIDRALEILTERREDDYERRELAEYNASHMPGKV